MDYRTLGLFCSSDINNLEGLQWQMGGLDAPRLRIKVVGTIADILNGSEGDAFISDGNDPTRGIGRKHNGLAPQITYSFAVWHSDIDVAML